MASRILVGVIVAAMVWQVVNQQLVLKPSNIHVISFRNLIDVILCVFYLVSMVDIGVRYIMRCAFVNIYFEPVSQFVNMMNPKTGPFFF